MRRLGMVLVLLLVMSGCGGTSEKKADPPPFAGQDLTAVLAEAVKAAQDAPSLTIRGEGDQDGDRFRLNLSYAGDTTSGTVDNTFGTLSLLRVGGDDYATPTNGYFYDQLEKRAFDLEDEVDGRWIRLSPRNEIIFLHRDDFVRSTLKVKGTMKRTAVKTLYGKECVGLEHDGGTVYVSVKEKRPVQAIDGAGNVVNFEYVEHEEPVPPEADEIVDPRELTAFEDLAV